jgi:hypothetical protein
MHLSESSTSSGKHVADGRAGATVQLSEAIRDIAAVMLPGRLTRTALSVVSVPY